jgi:hypothetical protein
MQPKNKKDKIQEILDVNMKKMENTDGTILFTGTDSDLSYLKLYKDNTKYYIDDSDNQIYECSNNLD